MLNYMLTAFRSEQASKNSMISEYTAEAAIEYAIYSLLHTDDVDATDGRPWTGYADINGETIPVILSLVPLGEFIDEALPGNPMTHTVPAGHQLEMKLLVTTVGEIDPSFAHWFAYDTALFPAQILIPVKDVGIVSYYWHNFPTPPTGETESQINLPLDTTIPTADTLHDYDSLDNDPGRLINKTNNDPDEDRLNHHQVWRTEPLAEDLEIDASEGNVGLLFWWGMKNFKTTFDAAGKFYFRDYDPVAGTYWEDALGNTYFGVIEHYEDQWARTYDFTSTVGDATISGRVKLFSDRVEILSWEVT